MKEFKNFSKYPIETNKKLKIAQLLIICLAITTVWSNPTLQVVKSHGYRFLKEINGGCAFHHNGVDYALGVEDHKMFFNTFDLTNTGSTAMSIAKTYTWYGGFFVYKNSGWCAEKNGNVFIMNLKWQGFNLNTDSLANTVHEYPQSHTWKSWMGDSDITDPSDYVLMNWTGLETSPGVYENQVLRGTFGDYTDPVVTLVDGKHSFSVASKSGTTQFLISTKHNIY
jgi:hypothetical protein